MRNYYSTYDGKIYTAKEIKELDIAGYGGEFELIGKFKSREEARKYFWNNF